MSIQVSDDCNCHQSADVLLKIIRADDVNYSSQTIMCRTVVFLIRPNFTHLSEIFLVDAKLT